MRSEVHGDTIEEPVEAAEPEPRLDRRALMRRGLALLPVTAVTAAACDAVGDSGNPDMTLVKRATYGPTQPVLDRVAAIGAAAWVAEQLDPDALDTSAVDAKVATLPAIAMSPAEIQAAYPEMGAAQAAYQLQVATSIRQLESPAQLYERMVEFWSDHLNVPMIDQNSRILKPVEDREVIRPHALGRFSDLLVASAQSPAMLYYLDNRLSSVGAINENYGRELLELHTLGVDKGYTQDDIDAAARLLTGWGINPSTGRFVFDLARHDTSPVSIVGWDRPVGGDPLDHGVQFLRYLAAHPNTAEFICTKLVRRFVADDPDPALVAELAAVYSANDTDIRPVLQTLLTHPTFTGSAGSKFRRPQEYLIACGRQVGATLDATTQTSQLAALGQVVQGLGQPPFLWPAPNGYPDTESAWLNTGAMVARWNTAADIANGSFAVMAYDFDAIRTGIGTRPFGEQLDIIADRVLHEPLTLAGKAVIAQDRGVDLDDELDGVWLFFNLRSILALLLSTNDNQYT